MQRPAPISRLSHPGLALQPLRNTGSLRKQNKALGLAVAIRSETCSSEGRAAQICNAGLLLHPYIARSGTRDGRTGDWTQAIYIYPRTRSFLAIVQFNRPFYCLFLFLLFCHHLVPRRCAGEQKPVGCEIKRETNTSTEHKHIARWRF